MATGTGNLPNQNMSFSPFAILTAEEMNDLVENIESLADGSGIGDVAITASNIDFTSFAWQNWTPTFTNLSGGTLVTARYLSLGKTIFFRVSYILTGANVSGSVSLTLPFPVASSYVIGSENIGNTSYLDAGTNTYLGVIYMTGSQNITLYSIGTSGSVAPRSPLSATAPFTWASSDRILLQGFYERN